jgi:hypothetical protein
MYLHRPMPFLQVRKCDPLDSNTDTCGYLGANLGSPCDPRLVARTQVDISLNGTYLLETPSSRHQLRCCVDVSQKPVTRSANRSVRSQDTLFWPKYSVIDFAHIISCTIRRRFQYVLWKRSGNASQSGMS